MQSTENIRQSEVSKTEGGTFFKAGHFRDALEHYKPIIDWLKDDKEFTYEQQTKRTALLLAAHLNCAACYLKLEEWGDAKQHCEMALTIDKGNKKALYRKGQALMGTGEWSAAKESFQAVGSMDLNDREAIDSQLVRCDMEINQGTSLGKSVRKKIFEKICSSLTIMDGYSYSEKLNILLKVVVWFLLLVLLIQCELAGPYCLISVAYFLYYFGTSKETRHWRQMSAYSVFNPRCERMDGTFTAEQFENEMLFRPLNSKRSN